MPGKASPSPKREQEYRSRSSRAGLTFPVSRIHRYLRRAYPKQRIGSTAPIYLAAALEYLIAELVEIAGTQCRDAGRRLIKPRHIRLAISSDQELSDLIGKAVIKEGGVQPHIESALLPKKKKTTSQDTDSTTQAGSKGKKAIKTPKQTAPKTRKSSEKKPTVVEVEDDDEDYSLQVI
ncbi:histone H2A [Saitozyma podzolica]|uniref:Histone H2A n=1 Tax=Saitozyma podzolica TaxID=1890683 RepID=A0A427YX23_9TREE|nr:histone H2A [Saitozyma podzolica]